MVMKKHYEPASSAHLCGALRFSLRFKAFR